MYLAASRFVHFFSLGDIFLFFFGLEHERAEKEKPKKRMLKGCEIVSIHTPMSFDTLIFCRSTLKAAQ